MSTLAKRIKELRTEKNLTQEEFGKVFGIVKSTVSLYESGKSTPDDEIKKKIAEYFNVSLDYLMGASDIKNPYMNKNIKSTDKEEQDIIPEEFTNPDEARAYVNRHQIFGSSGFDADKLDDDEILEFANDLLEQMKMVSYKYKK